MTDLDDLAKRLDATMRETAPNKYNVSAALIQEVRGLEAHEAALLGEALRRFGEDKARWEILGALVWDASAPSQLKRLSAFLNGIHTTDEV